jgi:threonine/homoserine/homoserine lactone efflux protein
VRIMSWSKYAEFLAFAVVLILIPGPDFAVATRNTLVGGRRRGSWTALGVSSSNLTQGTAAAAGLGALIVRVQPLFEAVKWAGVGYLVYLGAQAIRSAVRGEYPLVGGDEPGRRDGLNGWRQGFTSNITNPKVLVFYLACCRSSSPRARAWPGCSCWPGVTPSSASATCRCSSRACTAPGAC